MRYDRENRAVLLSVTELCAAAAGESDLRAGGGRFFDGSAAVGKEIHRALQEAGGENYTPEVPLTAEIPCGDFTYILDGRADGIVRDGGKITIDEIKSFFGNEFPKKPYPAHLAQAYCYGLMLCRNEGLDAVTVRLTYVRVKDRQTRIYAEQCKAEQLHGFVLALLTKISYRAEIWKERAEIRLPSAASGKFPYSSVREGQETMMTEVYRDVRAGKRLFLEAPTGIGKTLSALYPAVRALGEGKIDKIFYLTAKGVVRTEAYRAAGQIFEAGARLRTIILTAKEQLCPNESAKADPAGLSEHCNPADCPYARGFYERCPAAMKQLLTEGNGYPASVITTIAARYRICPYEFQLELSEFCDIVICDYNYVFDPDICLRRYFSEDAIPGKYALLVDEAHNLDDRARGMFSASFRSTDLVGIPEQIPEDDPFHAEIAQFCKETDRLRLLCKDTLERSSDGVERGYYLNRNSTGEYPACVRKILACAEDWAREHREDGAYLAVKTLIARLRRFVSASERFDRSFLTYVESEGDVRKIRLLCLDPSALLDERMRRAAAVVMFSATLTPLDYFADILGGGRNAVRLALPSPFPAENLGLFTATGISTRYGDRDRSLKAAVSLIAATVSGRKGNYIAYFPSYDYMEKARDAFCRRYPTLTVLSQKRGMTSAEKTEFLESFADDGQLRIGFCVLGGSFSEGVDLPGGRLIGVVIIGTGMPGISAERNILKEYYDSTREERGFDYAYTYPGMNRVLQAAGRVIRRESDRGVVVLADDRYAGEPLKSLFPAHWSHAICAGNAQELADLVDSFWENGG